MLFLRSFLLGRSAQFLRQSTRKEKEFPPFDNARECAGGLGIKTSRQWRRLRPAHLPAAPDLYYRNVGWISWYHFLGTEPRIYLSYEEARDTFARQCGVRTAREWQRLVLRNPNHPKNVPTCPDKHYKGRGWRGWYEFLGTVPRRAEKRDRLPDGHRHVMHRDGRDAQQQLLSDVMRARPDFRFIPLQFGLHASQLFSIAEPSTSPSPSIVAPDRWIPLRILFSRPYSGNTKVHVVRIEHGATIEMGTIVISDSGDVFSRWSAGGVENASGQSIPVSDFRQREELIAQLESWWLHGDRMAEEEWRVLLCRNYKRRKWQLSENLLRSKIFQPCGLTVRTPGSMDGVGTLIVGDKRVILRSATTAARTQTLRFQFSICMGSGRHRRPLSENDKFDFLIVCLPGLPDMERTSPVSFFLFSKSFAVDEEWISSASGSSGIFTISLYPPYTDYTSQPEQAEKQRRQAPFYVSNLEQFQTLWGALRRESGSVGGTGEQDSSISENGAGMGLGV